ncbi:MAG: hypothetical protein JNK82_25805 [Myxococcaceae bacterium]|nr:hypothetical protein [Myxococcaceae bacterium]
MRPLFIVTLLAAAACVRRMPGSADVPAAEQYVSAGSTRTTTNPLAGRVLATYPKMLHDPALDDVAKILAEDFGHSQQLPGPRYVQELAYRRGSLAQYRYAHSAWSTGAGGVAHLDSLLAAVLATDKDLDGMAFGIHRTRIAYVMIVADAPVAFEPIPKTLAPGQKFWLAGRLRTPGATSLLLWRPGETTSKPVLVQEDGTLERTELVAPETPGRYAVELASDGGKRSARLALVPLTVGAPPPPEALDRLPLDSTEAVENEARRIAGYWRTLAGKPPLGVDPLADSKAREKKDDESGRWQMRQAWETSRKSDRAWDHMMLDLAWPDAAARFDGDGDVLAIGASQQSDTRTLRIEVLQKKNP